MIKEKGHIMLYLVLILLVAGLAVTVYLVGTKKIFKSKASSSGPSLKLTEIVNAGLGKQFEENVIVDPQGEAVFGVDVAASFDKDFLTLSDIVVKADSGFDLSLPIKADHSFDKDRLIRQANTGGAVEFGALCWKDGKCTGGVRSPVNIAVLKFTPRKTGATRIFLNFNPANKASTENSNLLDKDGKNLLQTIGNSAVAISQIMAVSSPAASATTITPLPSAGGLLSPPARLKVACPSPQESKTILSWSPVAGATRYILRVDYTANNTGSNPYATGQGEWAKNDGKDVYLDDYPATVGADGQIHYSFDAVPGQPYRWWLHAGIGTQATTGYDSNVSHSYADGGAFTCQGYSISGTVLTGDTSRYNGTLSVGSTEGGAITYGNRDGTFTIANLPLTPRQAPDYYQLWMTIPAGYKVISSNLAGWSCGGQQRPPAGCSGTLYGSVLKSTLLQTSPAPVTIRLAPVP